jgi:hypothetical protein
MSHKLIARPQLSESFASTFRATISLEQFFVFKGRRPTSGAILSMDGTGSGFGLALTHAT